MSRHLRTVPEPDYAGLEAQVDALDRPCPRCGRAAGDWCVGTITGGHMRALHWQRLRSSVVSEDRQRYGDRTAGHATGRPSKESR